VQREPLDIDSDIGHGNPGTIPLMRQAKIVCGSFDHRFRRLIDAGTKGIRLNFPHRDHEGHDRSIVVTAGLPIAKTGTTNSVHAVTV